MEPIKKLLQNKFFSELNKRKKEIDNEIVKVINNCDFIQGKIVTEFENNFAKYIGSKYCIGVGNGTDALEIAVNCLNFGKILE